MSATAITIRRNKDGQQNLTDLRKALAESPHVVYSQGGGWIMGRWSESHGAYLERPAPHYWGEREAIQSVLFGGIETECDYHQYRNKN